MEPRRRTRLLVVGGLVAAAVVAGGLVVRQVGDEPREPAPVVATTPTTEPPPEAPAAPVQAADPYPADPTAYDLSALPATHVYAVLPSVPLDPTPAEPTLPLTARPASASIPVFAAPGSPPVAQLAAEQQHDGTTVPVIEQYASWVRVLLPARAGLPSEGVVGQTTGWLRTADVTLADNPFLVTVSLSTGQLSISSAGAPVHGTSGFGYGVPATPTPLGRTFVMTTFTNPDAAYTRGLPIVALAVQSPTLDGFLGADVAVTAFHYHDRRSGPVSNGCIRVDEATILQLAALPLGTPVMVTA